MDECTTPQSAHSHWQSKALSKAQSEKGAFHDNDQKSGVRGEGRGVSDSYGVRDAACPISTG
jgi:hypothetical protein